MKSKLMTVLFILLIAMGSCTTTGSGGHQSGSVELQVLEPKAGGPAIIVPVTVNGVQLEPGLFTGGGSVGLVLNPDDWVSAHLPHYTNQRVLVDAKVSDSLVLGGVEVRRTPRDPGFISTIGLKPFSGYNIYISLKNGVARIFPESQIPDIARSWTTAVLSGGEASVIEVKMPNGKKYKALIDISEYSYSNGKVISNSVLNAELSQYLSRSSEIEIAGHKFSGISFTMRILPDEVPMQPFDMILGAAFFSEHDVMIAVARNLLYIENDLPKQ